jgi:hypothetical protein
MLKEIVEKEGYSKWLFLTSLCFAKTPPITEAGGLGG